MNTQLHHRNPTTIAGVGLGFFLPPFAEGQWLAQSRRTSNEGKEDLLGFFSILKATGNVFKAPTCPTTPFRAGFVLTEVQAPRELQVGALPVGIDSRHSELVVSLFWQVADRELGAGHVGLVAPDPGEAGEFLALHDVAVHRDGPLHPRRGPRQGH